jgi:hypothetical protein
VTNKNFVGRCCQHIIQQECLTNNRTELVFEALRRTILIFVGVLTGQQTSITRGLGRCISETQQGRRKANNLFIVISRLDIHTMLRDEIATNKSNLIVHMNEYMHK